MSKLDFSKVRNETSEFCSCSSLSTRRHSRDALRYDTIRYVTIWSMSCLRYLSFKHAKRKSSFVRTFRSRSVNRSQSVAWRDRDGRVVFTFRSDHDSAPPVKEFVDQLPQAILLSFRGMCRADHDRTPKRENVGGKEKKNEDERRDSPKLGRSRFSNWITVPTDLLARRSKSRSTLISMHLRRGRSRRTGNVLRTCRF